MKSHLSHHLKYNHWIMFKANYIIKSWVSRIFLHTRWWYPGQYWQWMVVFTSVSPQVANWWTIMLSPHQLHFWYWRQPGSIVIVTKMWKRCRYYNMIWLLYCHDSLLFDTIPKASHESIKSVMLTPSIYTFTFI